MNNKKFVLVVATIAALVVAGCREATPPLPTAPQPALTVTATTPRLESWPLRVSAAGNIAAWQEAVIGPELSNFRLVEVRVSVGDQVRKGEILARIASDVVDSELSEARAAEAEAAATLREAQANHERARQLREKGFYSPQQSIQSETATATALARLNAARARLRSAELRRAKTDIVAPDHGVISASQATVGSLTQPGQELFRLIRGGRLEWRAEVTAAERVRIRPGQSARLEGPNGTSLTGTVRIVAPTLDPRSRTGLVYVDLPAESAQVVSAGMFARGFIEGGQRPAITLPQSAVQLREGFAYVFRLDDSPPPAAESLNRVTRVKVTTGRRWDDRVEVIAGLDPATPVVLGGAGFLADGDRVRLVADGEAR